jgi:hypothetical protein
MPWRAIRLPSSSSPQAFAPGRARDHAQSFDADEFFREIDRPAQICRDRIGALGQFVPIEWHAGFQAQRVARAKTRGLDRRIGLVEFSAQQLQRHRRGFGGRIISTPSSPV